MATATVRATNTNNRVNDSDANTNWGNWGSGGGAPASEAQLAYQGSGAVNTQVKTTSLDGIDYDPGTGALNMTTGGHDGGRMLWVVKVIVGDSFDLNATEGVRVAMGSANNAYYYYNVAGTGEVSNTGVYNTYPDQGGYLITAIDPNVSTWRTASGSPTLTAFDWYGAQCAMVTGAAKNENLALDAIDVGIGLQVHGGDGADADADMDLLVTQDQGTSSNRWGYVTAKSGIVFVHGRIFVGTSNTTSTATVWTDNDSIVVFPDYYGSAGLAGFEWDLGSASTVCTVGMQIIGNGALVSGNDTRPDFAVTGSSGTLTLTGQLVNHNQVTFTSGVTATGARIECADITQGGADIEGGTVVVTDTATQVAACNDPTFGTTSLLNNMEWVQGGSGHAIEFTSGTDITLTGIGFTGYGGTPGSNGTPSSGANDAAVYNNTGGALTLRISGGDTPSVRNAASSTTTVIVSNELEFTGLVDPTEVRVYDAGTTTEISGNENVTNGTVAFQVDPNTYPDVDVRIFAKSYIPQFLEGIDMTVGDLSIPIVQIFDRVYNNPQGGPEAPESALLSHGVM